MIFRSEKGSPLTIHEMDGNFKELYLDLQKIKDQLNENHQQKIERKQSRFTLKQKGRVIEISEENQGVVGDITLPMTKPHVRGIWEEGSSYKVFDWIYEKGKIYSCIASHTGKSFKEECDFWEIVLDSNAPINNK